MLSTLSAELFSPLAGSAFLLRGAGGLTVPVSLARCDETPRATMPGSPRKAFTLEFCCPAAGIPPFTGGDVLLSHESLGEIGPLHVERILPVGYGPDTAVFQAVFN